MKIAKCFIWVGFVVARVIFCDLHFYIARIDNEMAKIDISNGTISVKFLDEIVNPLSASIESNIKSGPYRKKLEIVLDIVNKKYNEFLTIIKDSSDNVTFLEIQSDLRQKIVFNNFIINNIIYNVANQILHELTSKKTDKSWCINEIETNKYINDIINVNSLVTLGELKHYVILKLYNILNKKYEAGINKNLIFKFRKTLKDFNLKTEIRRCDPKRFIRGSNYYQFSQLLQGYIENLNGSTSSMVYKNGCRKLAKCKRVTGKACISSFSQRRYDFIEETNKKLYGKMQYCSQSKLVTWDESLRFCLCDETTTLTQNRYISMRHVFSSVRKNRVITGLRFSKPHNMLYIQIQEGEITINGEIKESTINWVPIEEFNITDQGVFENSHFVYIEGNRRTMSVEEIETKMDDYVMTGVGFKIESNNIVYLKITLTKIDWTTGKLFVNETQHLPQQEDINNSDRQKITPLSPDVPTYTDRPSEILYQSKSIFVDFINTGIDQDAAQTTVPFLDAQEVVSFPAAPLIGAGIYYKAREGYGGFLAPMIKTYDYIKRIKLL